ncbi:MAG TPA: hypothetical protein VGK48_17545 [Terriglobia bacterium]
MIEFAAQHQFGLLLVLALVISLSACANRYVVHPGALNQADSVAYDALMVAGVTIDQARVLPLDGSAKPALDALIKSYNLARASWIAYRGAMTTNAPPQQYLDTLNQNLSDLTTAIRAFEEAQ